MFILILWLDRSLTEMNSLLFYVTIYIKKIKRKNYQQKEMLY